MTVLDGTEDITELEKFSPERVDAVDLPATGTPFLLLKRTGGAPAAPGLTEKAVDPVGAPQDEDVVKDWAAWDAAHPGSHRPGQGAGAAPAKNPKDPGTSQADASAAYAHAHGTLAEEQAGGKPSAADLQNAHDVHVAHEEHMAHLAAQWKKPAAAKPKAKAKTAAKPKAAAKPKTAAPAKKSTVTVELPPDVSVSFSPADLAKLTMLKRQLAEEQAAKRDMDPDVGGGTDRDKIPDEDFAGPHRSFPIVKPGDVSDAASSLGRADPEDREKVKAGIIAIARRKGKAHVDQLPDAWKDEDGEDAAKAGKPFPGAAPPFKAKYHGDDAGDAGDSADGDDADDDDDDDAGAEKSGRACKCGTALAKDARFCPQCGEKAVTKARACKCGTALAKDARFCPQCGEKAVTKARACKCGTALAKDARFCPQCGEKAPGEAEKGKVPSPEDAAVAGAVGQAKEAVRDAISAQGNDPDKDSHPADRAVSAHLNEAKHAIGNAEDAQEEDIETDDPAEHAAKTAAAEGPAYHLRRLHDATCAAYSLDDVVIAHPSAAKGIGELADPQSFASMVSAALADDGGTGSRAHEIPALSAAYHHAVTLKALAAQPGALDDAMGGLRKAFSEYYPDAHPQPGSVSPGQFKRPYVSAGHAGQSAAPGQEPRIPLAANVPSPSDFQRPLVTDGREAASPGSAPKPAPAQKAGRTYYSNVGKDGATGVLTAMHDWIADNHPGVCPMTGTSYDGEPSRPNSMGSSLTTAQPAPAQFPATRDKAVPVAVPAQAQAAFVTPSVTKADRKAAAKAARKAETMARQAAETAPAASPQLDPELLKAAFRDVVAEQLAELLPGVVTKATGALEERVAAMESAPDPAQMTPRSGSAVKKDANAGPEVPDGGDGHQVERLARLVKRAKDPDSNVRAAAIGELIDTAGREAAAQLLEAAY
jgi:RNA polymerase subunit RPABC4/transcription elongation factor Spt4